MSTIYACLQVIFLNTIESQRLVVVRLEVEVVAARHSRRKKAITVAQVSLHQDGQEILSKFQKKMVKIETFLQFNVLDIL